jgi:CubicO group peptidase (beta-lactamase class C family)
MSVQVEGHVEPGFEGVRDAFARNFTDHGDVGAGFCLHVEGRKVVDLWGGVRDAASGQAYDEDTLQLVFSTTKGATAACANLLAQRGLLDVDAPVSTYWPEFAQSGKEDIPVRWLLCHKAGLATIDKQLALPEALAWDPVIEALEVQEPLWEPGTAHGYHALTYGWLVGEVIRRIDGRSLGTFFKEELAEPLGLEFWIGLPEDQEHRVAPLVGSILPEGGGEVSAELQKMLEEFIGPNSLLGRALSMNGTFADPDCFNTRAVHAAEIGAANGITNARSLSRFYAGLIGSVPDGPAEALLTADQVDKARTVQTEGADKCLFFETTFGLGFMRSGVFSPYGGAGSFGHSGAGGSVGFADPENKIAAGYVMNRMLQNLSGDPRTRTLIQASYDAVGAKIDFV